MCRICAGSVPVGTGHPGASEASAAHGARRTPEIVLLRRTGHDVSRRPFVRRSRNRFPYASDNPHSATLLSTTRAPAPLGSAPRGPLLRLDWARLEAWIGLDRSWIARREIFGGPLFGFLRSDPALLCYPPARGRLPKHSSCLDRSRMRRKLGARFGVLCKPRSGRRPGGARRAVFVVCRHFRAIPPRRTPPRMQLAEARDNETGESGLVDAKIC